MPLRPRLLTAFLSKEIRSVEVNRRWRLKVVGRTPYSVSEVAKRAFQLLEFFGG